MRPRSALVIGTALAALCLVSVASPVSASQGAPTATSPFLPAPPFRPPRVRVFYGNLASLDRKGGRWELRVDPAEFLEGETARRAAVEDGATEPGQPVANDYYVRNESKRLLTYFVAPAAHVTVITDGTRATRISVTELSALVMGKNPRKRKLFGPRNGFWIQVRGDTVRAMDQQYRP
jgi:hypothetical protein